jgi:hypothetical protein
MTSTKQVQINTLRLTFATPEGYMILTYCHIKSLEISFPNKGNEQSLDSW